MRFLFLFALVSLFMHDAHAQYAYANAGVGYYGGTAPCPYGNGGVRRGKSAAAIEMRLDAKKEKLEDAKDELKELEDYDTDDLPLKRDAASVLLRVSKYLSRNATEVEKSELCLVGTDDTKLSADVREVNLLIGNMTVCEDIGDGKAPATLPIKELCNKQALYETPSGERALSISILSGRCERWVKDIKDAEKEVAELVDEVEDLEEQFAKAEDKEKRAEKKAEKFADKYGYYPSEADCWECHINPPEPKGPSNWQIGAAVISDAIGIWGYNRAYRYVSRNNAALGWDTAPPSPFGAYPFNTANLLAYRGGGHGSGSWGCAQTINGGYPNGASGIWGPNGPYSPYGNAGGLFYAPQGCGYGCVNPYAGNGPFIPGMAPWGASGPWGGGNGIFPMNPFGGINAYANLGIGNPFAGAYPGANFGGNAFGNPFMGGIYGNGSMSLYGQGPYGNPFGGNPFMGQNPFAAGWDPYALQSQQRALQNQLVVNNQLIGLSAEYQQLVQRYQRLMQYSTSGGGGFNAGFNFGVSGGFQSYNPYFLPGANPNIPGSNISNPPGTDGSSTGR